MEVEEHIDHMPSNGEEASDVLTYKIQAIIVIFAIGMAGGLFPLKRTSSQRFLSLGNAFSGGIFLSAAFVEMISEAVEGFERLHLETKFPVVMFFTVVGILIPFFIERVAMDSHDHNALVSREKNRASDSSAAENQSQLGIYVLWLSLGVHSIIEGMAVGVENHYNDITGILVAIISHKFFSAFALGVSLVKAGIPSRRTIQLAASFAASTPSGILIGILMTQALSGWFGSLLTEIMKAIAAGTFIYVALVEILLEEFDGHSHSHQHKHKDEETGEGHTHDEPETKKVHGPHASKGLKFTFLLLGVMMMTAFSMLHSHDHGGVDHGHDE